MASPVILSDDQVFGPQVLSDADVFGQAPVSAPQTADVRQQLMAGPVGQFMNGASQGLYGLGQDFYNWGSYLASAGGHYPNPVSRGMSDLGDSIGQTAAQSLQANKNARIAAGNDSPYNYPFYAGELGSPANLLGAETRLPAAIKTAAPKAAKLAQVLLQGAGYGVIAPVSPGQDFAATKSKQAALGAALSYGGNVLGNVANPSSWLKPSVQTLLDAKVPLTVGQTVGGTARTLEDAATSIPIVGDMIKARQREALRGLQTATINRSLAPIGETLPAGKSGYEAVQYAQGKLGDAYDSLLSGMSATHDPQLESDWTDLVDGSRQYYGLTPQRQQQLYDILQGQAQKARAGTFDGPALKDVQSNLSYQARTYAKSLDPDQKNLADALFDARDAFNDFIARQNPQHAPQLAAVNRGYANFARVQAASALSKTGIYSPSELARAVKAGGTRSTNATGSSLMQDLSSAGQEVLPSTVPDSGTPLRHFADIAIGALAGGGEHLATGDAGLGVLGAGTVLAAGASKPAQAALRALLTKRPYSPQSAAQLGALLTRGTPAVSAPVLVPALTQGGNN